MLMYLKRDFFIFIFSLLLGALVEKSLVDRNVTAQSATVQVSREHPQSVSRCHIDFVKAPKPVAMAGYTVQIWFPMPVRDKEKRTGGSTLSS